MLRINFPVIKMHIKVGELLRLMKEEKEILGSMEGLAELGANEYLMTVQEAKIDGW